MCELCREIIQENTAKTCVIVVTFERFFNKRSVVMYVFTDELYERDITVGFFRIKIRKALNALQ